MAYQNESYTGRSFTGVQYLTRGNFIPPNPGVYIGESYTNKGYTGDSYSSITPVAEFFNQTGIAAELEVQGFAGGIPYTEGGTGASVAVNTGWGGFNPDPGGIMANDSSDEGPLSYTVIIPPEAGTLNAYAGGAFTWDITPSTPVGRYSWTYGLYVNGTQQGVGTVTMEHGDLFAKVGAQGFAGSLTITDAFSEQGTRGNVTVTGNAGDLTLVFNKTGTAASVTPEGKAGTLTGGQDLRGTRAQLTVTGNAGFLVGDFNQQGSSAVVSVTGNAGTLDVGTFFNAQGSAGEVTITGNAGSFVTGTFSQQGTAASVTPQGRFGTILFGWNLGGSAADVLPVGFSPIPTGLDQGQFLILVEPDIFTVTVEAETFTIVVERELLAIEVAA